MTLEARRAAETRFGRTGVIIVGAVVAVLAVTGGAFAIAGANPVEAYFAYFVAPLTREFTLWEVLNVSTPLLFAGAAVAIAFRSGYWNIGVEGQLLMGAVAAAGIGQVVHGWPSIVVLPLMIVAGALAGAAWALVPALLRVRLGIDEVVTTLLLNPVALLVVEALLHGPWTDPETGFPESPRIAEAAEFPKLAAFLPFLGKSRLHLGFILAIVIIVAAWWVLSRTSTGLRVRAVGLSPHGARFAGIKVERTLLRVALISGAVAGDRRRQRGGRHPVPPHGGHLARVRLHGHRGGHAGRPDDARRPPGRPAAGRPRRGRLVRGAQPADPLAAGGRGGGHPAAGRHRGPGAAPGQVTPGG